MAKPELPIDALNEVAASFNGRMGFYIEDLNSGLRHQHNEGQRFPTASVCKISVMIELFRQVDSGELSFDDRQRGVVQSGCTDARWRRFDVRR